MPRGLSEHFFVSYCENLFFRVRFKVTDIPSSVTKGAPDFCNVYVISKGKVQSQRSALRPAPANSPLRFEFEKTSSLNSEPLEPNVSPSPTASMKG